MRLRRCCTLALLLAALPATGCTQTASTTTTAVASTGVDNGQPAVQILPSSFLGSVPCEALPGAMQSYVVTFMDLGPVIPDGTGSYPLTLPSSPPTSCAQSVYFDYATVNHQYVAQIDGYEQAPSELVAACSVPPPYVCVASQDAPVGGGSCDAGAQCFANGCFGECVGQPKQTVDPVTGCDLVRDANEQIELVPACRYTAVTGDRHMVTPGTFAPVSPRWVTPATEPCGYVSPAVAEDFTVVPIAGCGALEDHGVAGPTGIEVQPLASLGTFACAGGTGSTATVTSFDVLPVNASGVPALAPHAGVACKAGAKVDYTQGVQPVQSYAFALQAHENGNPVATLKASCVATSVAGVIVLAACDALVPIGDAGP